MTEPKGITHTVEPKALHSRVCTPGQPWTDDMRGELTVAHPDAREVPIRRRHQQPGVVRCPNCALNFRPGDLIGRFAE